MRISRKNSWKADILKIKIYLLGHFFLFVKMDIDEEFCMHGHWVKFQGYSDLYNLGAPALNTSGRYSARQEDCCNPGNYKRGMVSISVLERG